MHDYRSAISLVRIRPSSCLTVVLTESSWLIHMPLVVGLSFDVHYACFSLRVVGERCYMCWHALVEGGGVVEPCAL